MALEREPLKLSPDFQYALDLVERTDANAFITGRAGTGKSTLLQLFQRSTRKKTVVLAPTGVAALNVGGQTIHSFFGFPPRLLSPSDIRKRRNRRLYENLDVLVIDEISMVRADLLDHIDLFLRVNRENPAPFGGVQMVFFGDLFQLPPVVSSDAERQLFRTYYDSPYFFSAQVLQGGFRMEMIELQQVYRQEERHFLRLLEAVRLNRADYDTLEELNRRYLPGFDEAGLFITLSARNATVDRINRTELDKLEAPAVSFPAKVTGQFNPAVFPTEAQLALKEGAQVMFLRNDPERQYVNGTIGRVTHLRSDEIRVRLQGSNGPAQELTVQPIEWEILKYRTSETDPDKIETEVAGTFTQYPLKLAWAITIHKAQGKTFDRAVIDLGRGAFEHGQTYVALSRCRTLEGIVLKEKLRMEDILVDPRIVEFYEQQSR